MSGLEREAKNSYYIKYFMDTQVIILLEKGRQFSENSCAMQLIVSHLVWDEHILMNYIGVYFIYLMIYIFSCTNGYVIYCV